MDLDGNIESIYASIVHDLRQKSENQGIGPNTRAEVSNSNASDQMRRLGQSPTLSLKSGSNHRGEPNKHESPYADGYISPKQFQSSYLDNLQKDMMLKEFENILSIKRGKMMSTLKVEEIYAKIHLIEDIVDQCSSAGHQKILTLNQLQEYTLNLGAL